MQISNASNRLKNFSHRKSSLAPHSKNGPRSQSNFLANSNLFSSLGDDNITIDSEILNNAHQLRKGEKNIADFYNSPTPDKKTFGLAGMNFSDNTDTESLARGPTKNKKNLFLKSQNQRILDENVSEIEDTESVAYPARNFQNFQKPRVQNDSENEAKESSESIKFPSPNPPNGARPKTAGRQVKVDPLRSSYDVPSISDSTESEIPSEIQVPGRAQNVLNLDQTFEQIPVRSTRSQQSVKSVTFADLQDQRRESLSSTSTVRNVIDGDEDIFAQLQAINESDLENSEIKGGVACGVSPCKI